MNEKNKGQIIIYKDKSGQSQIDVRVEKETVWLTQLQMSKLFNKNLRTINEHIGNIFEEGELQKNSVIRKFRITAKDGKIYDTNFYSLDVIISVGYRVKSKTGTQFRIWATDILKKHLMHGYTLNQKLLSEQKEKLSSLQESIKFIEKKADNYLLKGKSRELLSLINELAKSLSVLEQYDKGKIKIGKTAPAKFELNYEKCKNIIIGIKAELKSNSEAGDLFGQEYGNKFEAIINSIYQTFDKKELYNSIEEKAAHLLYLTIKDHPFADGNKRIAAVLFVYFLDKNNFLYTKDLQRKITNNTLISLALLVATSDPKEKETIIKIIISLLQ